MDKKRGKFWNLFIIIAILLTFVLPVHASWLSSALDPLESLWQGLTNAVEEELERSRVGRELNRVIEDAEGVSHILEEVQNLALIATASTPPGAIVSFAVSYGHDPDKLFNRFQQRVQSL